MFAASVAVFIPNIALAAFARPVTRPIRLCPVKSLVPVFNAAIAAPSNRMLVIVLRTGSGKELKPSIREVAVCVMAFKIDNRPLSPMVTISSSQAAFNCIDCFSSVVIASAFSRCAEPKEF
ncbi:hypothetical protein D1872_227990 [compost metagenome]